MVLLMGVCLMGDGVVLLDWGVYVCVHTCFLVLSCAFVYTTVCISV